MLSIRPFKKGFDEEAFVSIFNACFGDYDDIREMTLEEMKKMEELPSFNTDGMLVAEWNGETAGMINAYVDKLREEKKGFIQWLGVLPKFRGNGVAKRLVQKAIESLRQRGMKVAETWAQTDRKACMHIFEGFGFKQIRTTSIMRSNLNTIPLDIGENKEIGIRKAKLSDDNEIELINRLNNEVFKDHFNFRPKPIEETRYMLLELPWFQNQTVFFALLQSLPVGFVVAGIDEGLNKEKNVRYGWILDIGVLKRHRRKGIGTSLMLNAMRLLSAYKMEDALLYVDDMNPTEAVKLYEKLGFSTLRKNIVYQLPINKA
ncbi:GNAT family N-acetyltransferase [Candidatus Bathyarchaeota archaeon]|nr:GNAT family N-acetyltransferase [Candidatus Bathyarchaeota archaeon]